MRLGRYTLYYDGEFVQKFWTLKSVYEMIASMVTCGYEKEKFKVDWLEFGFDI